MLLSKITKSQRAKKLYKCLDAADRKAARPAEAAKRVNARNTEVQVAPEARTTYRGRRRPTVTVCTDVAESASLPVAIARGGEVTLRKEKAIVLNNIAIERKTLYCHKNTKRTNQHIVILNKSNKM